MKLAKTFLAAILVFILIAGKTSATSPGAIDYQGISLSPAIQNLTLKPGQNSNSFKIFVTNQLNKTVDLQLSSLDFKSLNETGGIAFIGDTAANKYGLANWITFPTPSIELKPKEGKLVEITIDNRADLSPGGHYAAILFKSKNLSSSGPNRVSVNQVVSSLILVRKLGGERYSLDINQPKIHTAWFGLPKNINLIIHNGGNTQTAPRGIVNLFGPGGKMYGHGIINSGSGLVLPDSNRLYITPVVASGHAWLPGRYKLEVSYRPDDITQAQTVEYSFIYVNLPSLLFFAAGLLIPMIGWLYWRNYRSWR